jgi:L-2-hydroxyglutarate oxidase
VDSKIFDFQKFEVIIVGGGIVGCASALQLLRKKPGLKLLLLEKEASLAKHQSSNNSGVIHSGLYYKPGSLKAMNCRQGYLELLNFCEVENIPYEICGKIVVATSLEEIPRLNELHARGIANGLKGLRYLSPNEILEVEPNCVGLAALSVPETGIIDYRKLTQKYAEKILELGGEIKLNQKVVNIISKSDAVEVVTLDHAWSARSVITCAGLYSDRLARKVDPKLPLRIIPFRGEYYKLNSASNYLVKNLIYPVPDPSFPFLGVHFTRMLSGEIECGPNAVFAFGREAYRWRDVHFRDTLDSIVWPGFHKVVAKYWRQGIGEFYRSLRKQAFVTALKKLVPTVESNQLERAGAGIRAQACDVDGQLLDDFCIRSSERVIQVCNAPSPAATASLSIGSYIAERALNFL